MKRLTVASLGAALVFSALLWSPLHNPVSAATSPTDEIIRLEARWIAAILEGDKATVASILSSRFKHILNDGKLIDRTQELASITKEPFAIALSEQTVDLDATGDAAVIHGLDTVTQDGRTIRHQRFTDVFFKENGTWMAVSAQENVVTP
jgi:Domain of unknown function (DUF4440)